MKDPLCKIYRPMPQVNGNTEQRVCNRRSFYIVLERYYVCRECGDQYIRRNPYNAADNIKIIDERLANFT